MVSLLALWEGSCYIDDYPFERGSNTVLGHMVPILGPDAGTCCRDVALSAQTLNIASCLEPVLPLSNITQGC
jgi:hypothetical protein